MANRVKEDEKNERTIRSLLKLQENRRCINCNSLVCSLIPCWSTFALFGWFYLVTSVLNLIPFLKWLIIKCLIIGIIPPPLCYDMLSCYISLTVEWIFYSLWFVGRINTICNVIHELIEL